MCRNQVRELVEPVVWPAGHDLGGLGDSQPFLYVGDRVGPSLEFFHGARQGLGPF